MPTGSQAVSELLLWRHAEAEDPVPGRISDPQRALTARGRGQARTMADWLESRLTPAARILVSPALRTVQTADALGRPYSLEPLVGLAATPESLLAAAGWPAPGTTLVVGHQPTLGQVLARLQSLGNDAALDRCELAWIEHDGSRTRLKLRFRPQATSPGR